jgi:A/G-specific adenine glycosylase
VNTNSGFIDLMTIKTLIKNLEKMPKTLPSFTFSQELLAWFDKHGRKDLPWQQQKSRYSVWVSEIMLQQTQVSTVIAYFKAFMQRFPSVIDLANAPQDDVLHLWTGLGYYARARNLHKAAQRVVDEFDGVLPSNFDDLLSLPGIGRSTAAAVLSLADNQPYVILDGNVKRVLARFFAVQGWPGNKKIEDAMWQMAESLKPENSLADSKTSPRFDDYTQAIMDLGATLCKRSKPKCDECPVQTHCLAFAQGRQNELPHKKPKKSIPTKRTHMLIPFINGSILMHKRPSSGIWGGLWGFYEVDETNGLVSRHSGAKLLDEHPQVLSSDIVKDLPRELSAVLLEQKAMIKVLESFTHTFSHFHLHISPILLELQSSELLPASATVSQKSLPQTVEEGTPQALVQADAQAEQRPLWFNVQEASKVGLAAPTVKICKQIQMMY